MPQPQTNSWQDADGEGCLKRAAETYRFIVGMRRTEETAGQLYALGCIDREIKLSIGREALVLGLMQARGDIDPVIAGRRCHGWLLAFGIEAPALLAALSAGNGCSFDRRDNRDLFSGRPLQHLYPCLDGAQTKLAWAASLGLAAKFDAARRKDAVVFVVLEGESLASKTLTRLLTFLVCWQLPIVVVVDHAMPSSRVPNDGIATEHALARGALLQFQTIEGIDHEVVANACRQAATRARNGDGPQGLIISSQAFRGHAHRPELSTDVRAELSCANSPSNTDKPRHLSVQPSDPLLVAKNRLLAFGKPGADAAHMIEADVRATLFDVRRDVRQRTAK